ncbi:MAG: hypothetical protein KBF73_11570 [Flavobacteriales bacterium]|nr:hypothetical protein [Flavobacteriales bacterium]
MALGIAGCNKDCPVEQMPDCWNPDISSEHLEPDTNSCLTGHKWKFYQIWLGGSQWEPSTYNPPYINTYPHHLLFDEDGLYYVEYRGDTVQSGRILTHNIEFPYYEVSEEKVTMEFLPDCVERDTFLMGYYAVSCQEYGDTLSPILAMFGQYYAYGGHNSRVGLFYDSVN